MRDRLDEFGDAAVVIVAFSSPEYVATYQRERLAPMPVIIDETRAVYQEYGLGRASVWRVWGPKAWWNFAGRVRRGARVELPMEDTFQLGGDFVIGRDGRIAFAFRSEDQDDRPSVDALIAAVHRA